MASGKKRTRQQFVTNFIKNHYGTKFYLPYSLTRKIQFALSFTDPRGIQRDSVISIYYDKVKRKMETGTSKNNRIFTLCVDLIN